MNALRHMSGAAPAASGRNALADMAEMLRQIGAQNSRQGMDTVLAHITPEEAMLLHQMGGSGRMDPATGALHFDSSGDGDGPGSGGGPGGGEDGGGGPGANPGGENAAHGVNESTTEGRDAAYGGGWGDIGGGIGDFFNDPRAFVARNLEPNIATPGVLGMVTGFATGGLLGTAGMAAMSEAARSIGDTVTGWAQDVTGLTASAPPGSVDYGQSNNGMGGGGSINGGFTFPAAQQSGPSVGGISLGGNQNALAQMGRNNNGGVYIGSMRG